MTPMSNLLAVTLAVALERGPNAKSWSMLEYRGGKTPRPSQPRERPLRIVGRRGEHHQWAGWWLGEESAWRCAQPRMRPAPVAGPRRNGRGCEPTCLLQAVEVVTAGQSSRAATNDSSSQGHVGRAAAGLAQTSNQTHHSSLRCGS